MTNVLETGDIDVTPKNFTSALVLNEKLSDSKVTIYSYSESVVLGEAKYIKDIELAVMHKMGGILLNVEFKDEQTGVKQADYCLFFDPRKSINQSFVNFNALEEFDFIISGSIHVSPKSISQPWLGLILLSERLSGVSEFIKYLKELNLLSKDKKICSIVTAQSTTRKSASRGNSNDVGRWTIVMMERYNRDHKENAHKKTGRGKSYARYFKS